MVVRRNIFNKEKYVQTHSFEKKLQNRNPLKFLSFMHSSVKGNKVVNLSLKSST